MYSVCSVVKRERYMKKVTPEEGQSADIIAENIEYMKELFPEAFTEDGVNFETLRQLLGDAKVLDEGEEKYGLNWHGKKKARQIALTPSTGTLLPCPEESVDWDTTKNLFIEGDNLEVLKLLQKSYANKIKMIYIDPPYNTGKEFIYPDKFQDNLNTYLKYTGQVDDEGMKFSSNTETGGRKHTNWLNMIYPRLKVARSLLSDDGVVFISIDDNEVTGLRKICDEIFGEENQINPIIHNKLNSKNDTVNVQRNHEYIICYRKKTAFTTNGKVKPSLINKEMEKVEVFKEGERYYLVKDPITTRGDGGTLNKRKNLGYTIYYNEKTKEFSAVQDYDIELAKTSNNEDEVYSDDERLIDSGYIKIRPPKVRGKLGAWTWDISKFNDQKDHILIRKTKNGYSVRKRLFVLPSEVYEEDGRYFINHEKISNSRSIIDYSTNQGAKQVSDLFGIDGLFDNPKNIYLIQYLVALIQDKKCTFLDFFAGSASSAHALMQQNAKDNGARRFIAVQLPEKIENGSVAYESGYKTIADISKERICRAAKKIQEENTGYKGDFGFKVFRLASSNIQVWNPDRSDLEETLLSHQEHLIEGRSEQDVLYELLLKRGVDLAVPIESREVAGKNIYSIGYGVLFACLDESITREQVEDIAQAIIDWHAELAPSSETHVFFRDSAFRDDVSKTNMAAILEQNGITHVRSL